MTDNNKNTDWFFLSRMIGVLIFFLAIEACSGYKPIPGMKETFHTEIAPNGAKRFTFTLKREQWDIPAPVKASSSNPRRMQREATGRGTGSNRRIEDHFDSMLEKKLMETGFCEQGYFEIERTISGHGGEVRGECREGAF
ncbi:hypothetical protein [Microbulbifer epialgicus]|uniref:Lipoprotein n=1 Tax=Microbulbifer epialgicus TaxID=393907 RepID=A0ABV4P256_9GAMM